jgi:hypothetical protein
MVKFGSLDVVLVNQIFSLSFDGPNGLMGLGAGNDLKAFIEGRIGSRMSSPALELELGKLKDFGDAHDWNFAAMSVPANAA